MKTIIYINGQEVEITLTDEQIEAINKANKQKFKWNYEDGNTCLVTCNDIWKACDCDDEDYVEHGRYRKTEEGAELSLDRNKRANRLEALAEQLGGLKKFEYGKANYFVSKYKKKWEYYFEYDMYSPEKVYMTKEYAIEICRMLNENEFSLDGEL